MCMAFVVRCPDCGHPLDVPIDVHTTRDDGGAARVRVTVDEKAFMPRMEAHVMLNPELHSSFIRSH